VRFIFIVLSIFLFSCTQQISYKPVNPRLIPEGKQLLNYLQSIRGNHTISGQHDYPHRLCISSDSVWAITGKHQGVWGSDMVITSKRQDVIDEAIRRWNQGYIITLMWHHRKPWDYNDKGFRGHVNDEQWRLFTTPGTMEHQLWINDIDEVAAYLKQLDDLNIPVLWRPYHEMNGAWFWWGDKKGPDGYQKMWKLMFERYVNFHKLDNLIWVWNANAPRNWENDEAYAYEHYFPGHEYVDILAADVYKNDFKQSHHDDLLTLAEGKLIALGEVGKMPTPEILDEQPEWLWFMTWAKFIWSVNPRQETRKLYNSERVLTLQDLEHKVYEKN